MLSRIAALDARALLTRSHALLRKLRSRFEQDRSENEAVFSEQLDLQATAQELDQLIESIERWLDGADTPACSVHQSRIEQTLALVKRVLEVLSFLDKLL